jgi:ferredoxin
MRTLPHDDMIRQSPHVEILDYEKATSIIESSDKFSIGYCSCRHEKQHVNEKKCDVPIESCTGFGYAADYLIRNNLAREISKSEMLEHLARSKEMGLVLNADNVQKNVTYICHCCGCCCNILLGISKYGYDNVVITSNYLARSDEQDCIGCGKCAKACPINAIEMQPLNPPIGKKKKQAKVDTSICIGCGVCALSCKKEALSLVKREQRALHPETTFHRVILQCLERGTLQNQMFDNPRSITQSFMRGIIGAFFKLEPVKKTLMSDTLRSSFLKAMETGVKMQGKGWLTKM